MSEVLNLNSSFSDATFARIYNSIYTLTSLAEWTAHWKRLLKLASEKTVSELLQMETTTDPFIIHKIANAIVFLNFPDDLVTKFPWIYKILFYVKGNQKALANLTLLEILDSPKHMERIFKQSTYGLTNEL